MQEQFRQIPVNKTVNVAVKIDNAVLPLSCPPSNMALWDMHPKVYLELDHQHQAVCPYCATLYILNEE